MFYFAAVPHGQYRTITRCCRQTIAVRELSTVY